MCFNETAVNTLLYLLANFLTAAKVQISISVIFYSVLCKYANTPNYSFCDKYA